MWVEMVEEDGGGRWWRSRGEGCGAGGGAGVKGVVPVAVEYVRLRIIEWPSPCSPSLVPVGCTLPLAPPPLALGLSCSSGVARARCRASRRASRASCVATWRREKHAHVRQGGRTGPNKEWV